MMVARYSRIILDHKGTKRMRRISFRIVWFFIFASVVLGQDSRDLRIIEQPIPDTPKGIIDARLTVRVIVEFLGNGEIGSVDLVSTLFRELDELAISAARQIKFEPKLVNGKPTTAKKTIEYRYEYGWKDNLSTKASARDEKAEAILARAIERVGGQKYLQTATQIGRGNFTQFVNGQVDIPASFVDVIVFPDKERTEFKHSGNKTVQTNVGSSGWIFDGAARTIKDQNKEALENFRRGMRTSLDYILRGYWRKENASLTYAGKREAALGIRNEVLKLTFADGFTVEFEFAATDGLPGKSIFKKLNADAEEVKEEDRYAQFVEIQGVFVPFVIDHFQNGKPTSRINYTSLEFNRPVPDSVFTKPKDLKELKKDLKL
jgi:hypothetical protein